MGEFVDSYGHHRAFLIFSNTYLDIKQTYANEDIAFNQMNMLEFCDLYIVDNPYLNPLKLYGYKYWGNVEQYTSPESLHPYSGISLNNFLRKGKIPNNSNFDEMVNRAAEINTAIDDFEIKEQIIVYRGFSIDKDSELCKTLDNALISLKDNVKVSFIDKGFVSTTLSLEYAIHRMNVSEGNAHIKMSIILDKGQKAMPLSHNMGTTFDDREKEILLKCNQKFDIVGMRRYTINKNIYYEIISLLKGDEYNEN